MRQARAAWDDVTSQRLEVDHLAARLRTIRERNRFGEKFTRALGGGSS